MIINDLFCMNQIVKTKNVHTRVYALDVYEFGLINRVRDKHI